MTRPRPIIYAGIIKGIYIYIIGNQSIKHNASIIGKIHWHIIAQLSFAKPLTYVPYAIHYYLSAKALKTRVYSYCVLD